MYAGSVAAWTVVVGGVAVVLVVRCWPREEDEDEYVSWATLAELQAIPHSTVGWGRYLER